MAIDHTYNTVSFGHLFITYPRLRPLDPHEMTTCPVANVGNSI